MKLEHLPREFTQALPVLEKIQAAGFEAYFVGGSVRDVLLGRAIHDVDIATSAYPSEIKKIFPYTIDVGIEHGTVLVLAGKSEAEHYEVTTFRTESTYTDFRRPDHVDFVRDLSEDLKRRDFTINAFAMRSDGEIIDLFDGLADLQAHLLRAVGQATERFNEDALRTLRAMRFAATLNFDIEPATFAALQEKAALLPKISIERSFIEIDKMMLAQRWKKGLQVLIDSGAWRYLPDFAQPDLSNLTENFRFKNSVQAWAWLTLQFDNQLKLRHWKVSNDFLKAVSNLTAAYQETDWNLTNIYKFGLATAQLADDLKLAQGQPIDPSISVKFDRALQIHDKSEILVKGADLIQLGFAPGPALGKILTDIEQKIVKNELKNDYKEIINYVQNT